MTNWPEIILKTDRGSNFSLTESCKVIYIPPGCFSSYTIIIPQGFQTDLSSIPKWFRWAISPSGKTKSASVVHDYLIRRNRYKEKFTDQIFRYLLLESGCKPIQAGIMYYSLRVASFLRLR